MESFEHEATEQMASFLVGVNRYSADDFRFTGIPQVQLSYGQIIALAGDHFNSFQELKNTPRATILEILVSDIYRKACHFDGSYFINQPDNHISYLLFAFFNPEHFRGAPIIESGRYMWNSLEDSIITYCDGHEAAIRHAQIAANDESAQRIAYAINAFYDHFLTDMFSSGHMRVPRRQLHFSPEHIYFPWRIGAAADLLTSKLMHDEDGKNGLWVTNLRTDIPWKAKGDGYQTKEEHDPNWSKCLTSVKLSVEEIEEAIKGTRIRDRTNFQALRIKPEVYPPGAEVHEQSKKDDYKVEMKRIDNKTIEFECYTVGPTALESSRLIIPLYLIDRAMDANRGNFISTIFIPLFRARGNPFTLRVRMIDKPLYELVTTFLRNPNLMGDIVDPGNPANAVQTYPLYVIADRRLFVRVGSTGVYPEENCNRYVTAEFIPSDPEAYDSLIPPQMTLRLIGRHQGFPVP